jgi:Fur family peroxide stress response transcriptional regulator
LNPLENIYYLRIVRQVSYEQFRELCQAHGLSATHQRHVIYNAVMAEDRKHGHHHSPEEVYEAIHTDLPSISLATVYKNLKTFVENHMLQPVSPHHGTFRVDANLAPHHHFVCSRCRSITDIDQAMLEPLHWKGGLPPGFEFLHYKVDIVGVCPACSAGAQDTVSK